MGWTRPLRSPGSDDWDERSGRNILAAEDRRIRESFPEFRRIAWLPGQSIWEGILQPFAQPYVVRICWCLDVRGPVVRSKYSSPRVFVLDPPLARRDEEPDRLIPHLYRQPAANLPAQLCLYWPDGLQFNASMYLGDSVVRWASEWLGYYELWHATGSWPGPEAPHALAEPRETTPPAEAVPKTGARVRIIADALLVAHPYLIASRHPVARQIDELAA
jgi:hypothetical protein